MTIQLEQLSVNVPELNRDSIHPELAPALIGQVELTHRESLQSIIDILESDEFSQAIDQGKITLGMIKPRLDEAVDEQHATTLEEVSDTAISKTILEEISKELSILLSISLTLSQEFIENFYAGPPVEKQSAIPAMEPDRYGKDFSNRWEEYVAMMERGPATFLILHDETGNAVPKWRALMGDNWNVPVLKEEDPDSLRARWARDSHNNIFHGSDSAESVKKEINNLSAALKELLRS